MKDTELKQYIQPSIYIMANLNPEITGKSCWILHQILKCAVTVRRVFTMLINIPKMMFLRSLENAHCIRFSQFPIPRGFLGGQPGKYRKILCFYPQCHVMSFGWKAEMAVIFFPQSFFFCLVFLTAVIINSSVLRIMEEMSWKIRLWEGFVIFFFFLYYYYFLHFLEIPAVYAQVLRESVLKILSIVTYKPRTWLIMHFLCFW